jgi:GNAT superfamily N-acetyltransferase
MAEAFQVRAAAPPDLRAMNAPMHGSRAYLMFVSDAAQGSGVGRALFGHMKRTAREHGFGTVTIGSHPPATGFYERMGAVRCGVSDPLPHVSWERPLLKLNVMEN